MAFAQHNAAHRDERRGGKSKFFSAEQRRNNHVAPSLQLAVGLNANATAQVIHQENLLRLGKPKLPGNPCVLDGTERRSPGASTVPGDEDYISVGLCHTGGHRSNANF